MPVAYRFSANGGGTSGTGNRTAGINTSEPGDLLVVFVKWSGNAATNPTCTDDYPGTYSLVLTALNNASADIMAVFVRNSLVPFSGFPTIAPVVGSGSKER